MSSVHSPGATSARQTKTKTTQGNNLSSMTSVFFSHNLSKKNSPPPPPKQTIVQVACCFRIERQVILTLALQRSLFPSPAPPPKKNYLSANAVLTQLVRCYFFVPPKEKGKKRRKNKRVKVLNEACTYIWVQSFRSGWMVG